MLLLSYRGIKKSYKDLDVIKAVDLDIYEGERIGIVGKNGAGKTTLANIIFGDLQPDDGAIIGKSSKINIGYLLQSTSYSVNTFGDILKNNSNTDIIGDFSEIISRMGLKGIKNFDTNRYSGLSSGERTKLALANIFVTKPDILLLDEPTNHLDFQGVDWLVGKLAKYSGTILIISHDRYFLDHTVNRIIEINDGIAKSYSGNYSFYWAEKKREYENQLHQYYEQEKRKEKIETEITEVKMWSAKAHRDAGKVGKMTEMRKGIKEFYRSAAKKMDNRVRSKVKRLERMKADGVPRPEDEPELNFLFEASGKHGRRILEAKNLTKIFGDRILFRGSSFFIQRGDKVGLLGPNGCGKTTLIKILLGEESLDKGEIWLSPSAGVTYISQDVEDLNPQNTPLEVLGVLPENNAGKARNILACLGIDTAMLKKQVKELSLGERTRVKIAGAILDGNDFLILDEPTNHLDMYSREQLENALEEFEGTILVISHDRYLLKKVCDKMLVFEDDKIIKYEDCFDEYQVNMEELKCNIKNDRQKIKEEKMVIENKIAELLGKLSRTPREDPMYICFDTEFQELINRKRELNK